MCIRDRINVCSYPASSNACRICPILPSIISDGATISAPAAAQLTAAFDKSSSVSSFSTSPSLMTPQWPWSVYSPVSYTHLDVYKRQLQNILDQAGELTKRIDYDTLITTEFAEKAVQE